MVQPLGDLFNGAVQRLVQTAARMKIVQVSRHQLHPCFCKMSRNVSISPGFNSFALAPRGLRMNSWNVLAPIWTASFARAAYPWQLKDGFRLIILSCFVGRRFFGQCFMSLTMFFANIIFLHNDIICLSSSIMYGWKQHESGSKTAPTDNHLPRKEKTFPARRNPYRE